MLKCMHLCLHSYKLTEINIAIRNTGIHTFNIIGICPWTNMHATLPIFIPLCYYCTLPAHISGKNWLLFTMILPYLFQQVYPSNDTHMPQMKTSSCVDKGSHVSTCFSYKLTAINNVSRNNGIHTFCITGICPWTNTPVTLHVCPTACLLPCTYRPNITKHIIRTKNFNIQCYWHICEQQLYPWNAT